MCGNENGTDDLTYNTCDLPLFRITHLSHRHTSITFFDELSSLAAVSEQIYWSFARSLHDPSALLQHAENKSVYAYGLVSDLMGK